MKDPRFSFTRKERPTTKQIKQICIIHKNLFSVLLQIDSSYTCWYDTRKSYIAQWNEPDARDGIIVLSCGGLALLLTIVFFYLSYRFSMQKRRQIARDNFMSIYTVRPVTN
jgi:hypothetical protein